MSIYLTKLIKQINCAMYTNIINTCKCSIFDIKFQNFTKVVFQNDPLSDFNITMPLLNPYANVL